LGGEDQGFSSTIDKLISKKISIDGNLMVKFNIISNTLSDDFQTTATYKYYYCPTENKRISAHVKHEALRAVLLLIILTTHKKRIRIIKKRKKGNKTKKLSK